MNALRYLMRNSKLSPAKLAEELFRRGQPYGAESCPSGVTLRRWLDGEKHLSRWAVRAIIEYAHELGWRAESPEDVRAVVRNYRANRPNARFSEFAHERRQYMTEAADLSRAWAEDLSAHPTSRMTAQDFEETVAAMPPPRRGRAPVQGLEYARRVLVDGRPALDVAEEAGVSRQMVSRAAARIWKLFSEGVT